MPVNFNYERAFSRNIGLFSTEEQKLLQSKKVAIPGCGGVGGIHAQTLARAGVGHFSIADFDQFDIENMNRQWGAKISTIGRDKVDVIAQEILDINPDAIIEVFKDGINENNIDSFLAGVDVVADSLDFFAFDARILLYQMARKKNIPVVTGGPIGFSCAMLIFTSDGMSFDDYFDIKNSDSYKAKGLKFALGLSPGATQLKYMDPKKIDFGAGKGPSVSVAVTLCAGMVGGNAIKILIERGQIKSAPHFAQYDVFRNKLRFGYLMFGNRGFIQRLKFWYISNFILMKR